MSLMIEMKGGQGQYWTGNHEDGGVLRLLKATGYINAYVWLGNTIKTSYNGFSLY